MVEMEARQMSGEAFSAFIKKLNSCIFELVKSADPNEKLGGIYAMDALVDVECEESSTFITRFANYLRQLLPCNDVGTMIMASAVLGHLAQVGGTLTADLVEFEAKRALEGLNAEKRSENQRLASVLVLKELAANAPTLFFMHVPAFAKAIWSGVRDQKQARPASPRSFPSQLNPLHPIRLCPVPARPRLAVLRTILGSSSPRLPHTLGPGDSGGVDRGAAGLPPHHRAARRDCLPRPARRNPFGSALTGWASAGHERSRRRPRRV